jgi:transcription factor SFP1
MDTTVPYENFNTAVESSFLPHIEQDILKDFSCCGVDLPDLHALLRHYEDLHVPSSPFDQEDGMMDLDTYGETNLPPTFQGKPDIAALKRRARASVIQSLGYSNALFDCDVEMKVNPKRAPLASPALRDEAHGSQWSSTQSSPIETPDQSFPSTPIALHDLDNSNQEWPQIPINQGSQPQAIRKARHPLHHDNPGVVSPENTIVVDKPYKCKNIGCDKAYKNMNGLKYHRMHGVCNKNNLAADLGESSPAPTTPPASGMCTPVASAPGSPALPLHANFTNPVIEEKRYSCEKCNKRYKNLNGLKYHRKATHKSVEEVANTSAFSLASGMSFVRH